MFARRLSVIGGLSPRDAIRANEQVFRRRTSARRRRNIWFHCFERPSRRKYDYNADLIFEDNYFVGPGVPVAVERWDTVRFLGNTLVGGASSTVGDTEIVLKLRRGDCYSSPFSTQIPLNYTWDDNAYCFNGAGTTPFLRHFTGAEYYNFADWRAVMSYANFSGNYDVSSTQVNGLPSANAVFVRPNAWERGRAHVVVYNWQGLGSVSVNLSATGLFNGEEFVVYNLQAFQPTGGTDYFGTVVASGTYSSGSPTVMVPMTDATVTAPTGFPHAVASTLPQFGTFLVRKTPCGDGFLDPGEACDDGDNSGGDGCSAGCDIEVCWNCAGEPSICTPAALGTSCPSDGNACTDDQCNGAGACGVNHTAPCSDGLFCNGVDVCSGGVCTHPGAS